MLRPMHARRVVHGNRIDIPKDNCRIEINIIGNT